MLVALLLLPPDGACVANVVLELVVVVDDADADTEAVVGVDDVALLMLED